MRKFLYATATQVGFIIGAGIFGVPYVAAQAGFKVGFFWIIVLGLAVLLTNLFYGTVVTRAGERHRLLPGHVSTLLGAKWKGWAVLINVLSFWAILVAYIIIGGEFLASLFKGWLAIPLVAHAIFYFTLAFLVFYGIRMVEGVEFIMAILLFLTMAIVIAQAFPRLDFTNLLSIRPRFFYLPYGPVLFALGGSPAVPLMYDIVGHNRRKLNLAIISGVGLAVVLTSLFVLAVVGVTGPLSTPEALAGLEKVLGSPVAMIGRLFGLLAVATSFLVLGLNLQEMFQYDLRRPRLWAWFLALGVPFLIFLAGARNFIQVIDWSGSIFSGAESILIVLLFLKVLSYRKRLRWRRALQTISAILISIFFSGIFAKLFL